MSQVILAGDDLEIVETLPLEQLLRGNTGENLIPNFQQVLESCKRNSKDYDHTLYKTDHDRDQVRQALRPFVDVIAHHDKAVVPLLMELAVIQDPRLQDRSKTGYQTLGSDAPQYFVSNFISYDDDDDDKAPPRRLQAWDDAIGELRNAVGTEDGPTQMIVPHTGAYGNLYLFARLGSGSKVGGRGPRGDAVWKNLYKLPTEEPSEKSTPVNMSVEILAREFNRLSPRTSAGESYLLVVPFRRPAIRGESNLGQEATPGERGGCLFVVFTKEGGLPTNPYDRREWLTSLSLKLSWLMSQAVVREAHTEISLRNYQRRTLATITHFLPTECGNVRYFLETVRAKLPVKLDKSIHSGLDRAQFHANRLDRLIEFSLLSWKINTGREAVQDFDSPPLSGREFADHFQTEAMECWKSVLNLQNPESSNNIDSNASIAFEINSSWRSDFEVNYSDKFLLAFLYETLHNAIQHGRRPNPDLRFTLGCCDDPVNSDRRLVYVTIENAVREQSVTRREMTAELDEVGNIGYQTLNLVAGAWGISSPSPGVCDLKAGRYQITLYIGIILTTTGIPHVRSLS